MLVGAVQQLDVQIAACLSSERSPKVLDQLDVELAYSILYVGHPVDNEGPAAEIDNRPDESLVHWHISGAESHDASLVPDSLGEGLTQSDPDIFD